MIRNDIPTSWLFYEFGNWGLESFIKRLIQAVDMRDYGLLASASFLLSPPIYRRIRVIPGVVKRKKKSAELTILYLNVHGGEIYRYWEFRVFRHLLLVCPHLLPDLTQHLAAAAAEEEVIRSSVWGFNKGMSWYWHWENSHLVNSPFSPQLEDEGIGICSMSRGQGCTVFCLPEILGEWSIH